MIDEQLRDDDSFVPAADDVSGGRCDDSQAGDALEVSEIAGDADLFARSHSG